MGEQERTSHEANIRAAERAHDANNQLHDQLNQAAIGSANVALRAFLLINGGAAIALLAFLGSLAGQIDGPDLVALATPMIDFAIGVAVAALAAGLAYLTNYSAAGTAANMDLSWSHPFVTPNRTTKFWTAIYIICILGAIAASFSSLYFFMTGVFEVVGAMQGIFGEAAP